MPRPSRLTRPAPPVHHANTSLPPLERQRRAPTAARPVRASARRLGPDTEIQPHQHPWAQLTISITGVARVTANHATYLVPSSRAVWIPRGTVHAVSVVEAAELRTVDVFQNDADAGPLVPREQMAAWRQCRVLEVSPLLRELVLQMDITPLGRTSTAVPGAAEPTGAEQLARERRLGELALDELRRAAPVRLGIELPQDKRLRSLCEAVLAEPARHATLEAWAAASGASTRTVARLFRQELGTSFGPWRQQVLLAHAMTLAARGLPMGLIAADLGYASASAFSAMVRRSVGAPPSRFFGRSPGAA